MQNNVRGTSYSAASTETLLDNVQQVDWQTSYEYDADEFGPVPEHSLGRDDGKAYEYKLLLATLMDVSGCNFADYYQRATGFDANGLHPPLLVEPVVPVSASSWAPASNFLTVEYPEIFIAPMTTAASPVGSFAFTFAASQVIVLLQHSPPVIPAAVTNAHYTLLGTRRSVVVVAPKEVVVALSAAQPWARRLSRYTSLVGRTQEVKDAQATILEEKTNVLSTFMGTDMENRICLYLTDANKSSRESSASGQSPARKRAHFGLSTGP